MYDFASERAVRAHVVYQVLAIRLKETIMAKAKREKIKLESTAGTGYFYTTSKNRRTSTGKLSLMKYDPRIRKHVLFKETKLK